MSSAGVRPARLYDTANVDQDAPDLVQDGGRGGSRAGLIGSRRQLNLRPILAHAEPGLVGSQLVLPFRAAIDQVLRACQEFRVWAMTKGRKEPSHGTPQSPGYP